MDNQQKKDKKKKKYFKDKGGPGLEKDRNYTGFILMCNKKREKNAIKDAYIFLNNVFIFFYRNQQIQSILQVVEDIYPNIDENIQQSSESDEEDSRKQVKTDNENINNEKKVEKPEECKDIDKQIEKELKQLKNSKIRKFDSIDTNIQCIVLIKINPKFQQTIDPSLVTLNILSKIHNEDEIIARHCLRILPGQKIFLMNKNYLFEQVKSLIDERIPSEKPCTWELQFKSRNNDKIKQKDVLDEIHPYMKDKNHVVEYKNPDYVIQIDILQNIAVCSVLTEYYKYKKYSLKTTKDLNQQQQQLKQKDDKKTQEVAQTKTEFLNQQDQDKVQEIDLI